MSGVSSDGNHSNAVARTLLALAVSLPFVPALTTRTLFFRDLYLQFFPMRRFAAEVYRAGQLPLWNPLYHGGMPFIADPTNLALYPTVLLWLVFPPVAALNGEIVFHFIAGGLLAFALAREVGASRTAAFTTGIAFALCGPMLSEACLPNRLCAATWMPAVVLCLARFQTRRRVRWLVLAAIAGSLQIFGGAAEIAMITWAFATTWLVVMSERKARAVAMASSAAIGAAAIAAAQILPTLDLMQQSVRGRGYATEGMLSSITPSHLLELLIPRFFGPTDRPDVYWGYFEQLSGPYLVSFYFGIALVALAVFGAFRGTLDRRLRFTIALFALGGIVVSMGSQVPLLSTIHELPFLRSLRSPMKALEMLPLTVALLAGAGMDAVRRTENARRLAITCAAAAALPAAVVIARVLVPGFANGFERLMFRAVLNPIMRPELQTSLLHATAFGLLAAAAALVGDERRRVVVLSAVVFADLALVSFRTNPTTDRDIFQAKPPLASVVGANAGGGRVYEDASRIPLRIRPPVDDIAWITRYNVATLTRYTATLFGLPAIFHEDFDGLATWLAMASKKRVSDTPWPQRGRLLTAADVAVVLEAERVDVPGFRLVAHASSPFRDIFVYSNENARRGAGIARRVSYAPSLNGVVRRLIDSSDDAVVFGRGPQRIRQGSAAMTAERARNNRSVYRVRADDDAFVLLDIAPVRGWSAFVDGRAAAFVPANLASSGVWIPRGEHRLEVVFAPASWRAGRTISLLALVAALVTLVLDIRRGRDLRAVELSPPAAV